MHKLNAYDLKRFYSSLRGRIVRKIISQKILQIWPDTKSLNLVGYGYAVPYLKAYMKDSACVTNMMPAQLGVHNWPQGENNLVCFNAEQWLPLETNSVDRILMMHALEFLDYPEETFEDLWRVLKSTGRVLIVVPNRVGFWARADWSPFGQGRPYSTRQVENFLSENLFVHERTYQALFTLPFRNTLFLRAANFFEKIGPYVMPALGGVTIIEASKQIYAGSGKGVKVSSRDKVKKAVSVKPVPTPRINSH